MAVGALWLVGLLLLRWDRLAVLFGLLLLLMALVGLADAIGNEHFACWCSAEYLNGRSVAVVGLRKLVRKLEVQDVKLYVG